MGSGSKQQQYVGSSGNALNSGFRHDSTARQMNKKFTGLYTGPYFAHEGNPANVTAQVGETAMIPCRVKQIGGRTVRS